MNPRRRRHKRLRKSASYQAYQAAGRYLYQLATNPKIDPMSAYGVVDKADRYPAAFQALLQNPGYKALASQYGRLARAVAWRQRYPQAASDGRYQLSEQPKSPGQTRAAAG